MKIKVPWGFPEPLPEGEIGVKQAPTPDSIEMGRHLSRFADQEEPAMLARMPRQLSRCHGCAFTLGSEANRSPGTLMVALKCVLEGVPFDCHENVGERCAGWLALASAPSGRGG